MTKLRCILLLGFSVMVATSFWYLTDTTDTWQQELSLYISTPQSEVVASSVVAINVSKSRSDFLNHFGGKEWLLEGEGIVSDLGDGKFIFSLIYPQRILLIEAMQDAGLISIGSHEGNMDAIRKFDQVVDVALIKLPKLIAFMDINDPSSVVEVQPNNLEKVFGKGYFLTRATIEKTSKAPTRGRLADTLPWWQEYQKSGRHFDGEMHKLTFVHSTLPQILTTSAFAAGRK